eukprot:g77500.t1
MSGIDYVALGDDQGHVGGWGVGRRVLAVLGALFLLSARLASNKFLLRADSSSNTEGGNSMRIKHIAPPALFLLPHELPVPPATLPPQGKEPKVSCFFTTATASKLYRDGKEDKAMKRLKLKTEDAFVYGLRLPSGSPSKLVAQPTSRVLNVLLTNNLPTLLFEPSGDLNEVVLGRIACWNPQETLPLPDSLSATFNQSGGPATSYVKTVVQGVKPDGSTIRPAYAYLTPASHSPSTSPSHSLHSHRSPYPLSPSASPSCSPSPEPPPVFVDKLPVTTVEYATPEQMYVLLGTDKHSWAFHTAQEQEPVANLTLLEFLTSQPSLQHIPVEQWAEREAWGGMFINGIPAELDHPLGGIQLPFLIEYFEPLGEWSSRADRFPAWDPSWIVHDKGGMIAVFKPAGLPTTPGKDQRQYSLVLYLKEAITEEVHLPSRLDNAAAGLILGTKEARMHAWVQNAYSRQGKDPNLQVYKEYLIVSDRPWPFNDTDSVVVRRRIGKNDIHPALRRPVPDAEECEGAQASHTRFTYIAQVPLDNTYDRNGKQLYYTLIHARPFTGRTHQIRLHAASIGLPLLGDAFYHAEEYGPVPIEPATADAPPVFSFPHEWNLHLLCFRLTIPLPVNQTKAALKRAKKKGPPAKPKPPKLLTVSVPPRLLPDWIAPENLEFVDERLVELGLDDVTADPWPEAAVALVYITAKCFRALSRLRSRTGSLTIRKPQKLLFTVYLFCRRTSTGTGRSLPKTTFSFLISRTGRVSATTPKTTLCFLFRRTGSVSANTPKTAGTQASDQPRPRHHNLLCNVIAELPSGTSGS